MSPVEALHAIAALGSEAPEELPEDFCPYEQFGGNMDDAYYGGMDRGELLGLASAAAIANEALALLPPETGQ